MARNNKESEEARPRHPLWLIWVAGGEWDRICRRVIRCGRVYQEANRQFGTEDPGAEGETCDMGPDACSYVLSHVGRGGRGINCSPGNRK